MDQHEFLKTVARLEAESARLAAEVTRLRDERIPRVDRSSRRRDRRLGIAYVLAAVLTVGLAGLGSAFALEGSDTVFSDDIVDGAVAGIDLRNNAVSSGKLLDGSVSGLDIRNATVKGADVADGSLTGADVNLFDDGRCSGETVQGTAIVNADPAVPDTPTPAWVGWQHSCSGEQVQVRRTSAGQYFVSFGPSNPARLAVVSSTIFSTFVSATWWAPGEFRVLVADDEGAGVDDDFQILVY